MISFKTKPLKREILLNQQHTENSRRSSTYSTSTHNSFLIEIDNNSDIDENIRCEINTRFNKSTVNATYKFPRISYQPFPSISLQQKFLLKEPTNKKVFKRISRGPIQLISHTPKPSLNKSIKITKRSYRARGTPSPESVDLRVISITPTPMMLTRKIKKKADFPILKKLGGKTPTPYISKQFQLTYQ